MKATLSPSQDFVQRRRRSIDAEDVLFKSLQGLQERNKINHRQQRKNSMDTAGRRPKQRHSTASYQTKRRNSIGGSTRGVSPIRARSSDGRTQRNAANPLKTQSCHGVGTKPRSLHLDDEQLAGGKVRQAHRLGRRASTGMASDGGSRIVPPERLNSNFQSNVRCVSPTRSEKCNAQSSGGVPRRMSGGVRMAQDCPGNMPGSFSTCIQTNVRLFTPAPAEVQPSSLGRHSSHGNPRRMRRRGSIGRDQKMRNVSPNRAAAGTQPPNLERGSSGGTPKRMRRRGSTGMAPETTPKMKQSNVPHSVSLHNDASSTPADRRRMSRRGSTGMAHDGEGRRGSGHQRNMNWGWGPPPEAPLQNGRRSKQQPLGRPSTESAGEVTRKSTRMRRRASTGMDQHAGVDPVIFPKTDSHRRPSHINSPKTPISQRKSSSKPQSPKPAAAVTCAPGVIRSFKRSSTSMSSASMTSTTTVMSNTSFENFGWGNGGTNTVTEDCST